MIMDLFGVYQILLTNFYYFVIYSTPTLNIAAPEYRGVESDPCRAAGDIWMIGNLLDDPIINRIQLSESARNFRDRLTQQNHSERPSAADAIDDDWFSDM